MSNFTRLSLLSFPNTDRLKYHADAISGCFNKAVMIPVFDLVTSSTTFNPCPRSFTSDLFS